jgi:alanine racemase
VFNDKRWAWAEIDLRAYAHNVAVMRERAGDGETWCVVKANAYGHGAVVCAEASISAGASGLCVALVGEGEALRLAGIAAPILVMSEQPPEQLDELVRYGLIATVYNEGAIDALARIAARAAIVAPVHLKVDTGMHRVGASPDNALALARRIADDPWLELDGIYTHLARADESSGDVDTRRQLDRFASVLSQLDAAGIRPHRIHVANSAATLRAVAHASAVTMHRAGIATYGIAPDPQDETLTMLKPVLALKARVSHVQVVPAGEGVSYGLRRPLGADTTVATLPLGYADGVPRRLWERGEVLIGGTRRRFAGVVTMDQVMVECASDVVRIGDEAVLIGSQDGQSISVNEWARLVDTIGYEIVCGISLRVPRRYLR